MNEHIKPFSPGWIRAGAQARQPQTNKLPAPLIEFWQCVTAMHTSGNPSDFALDGTFRNLMRKHRVTAKYALSNLAERGYLRSAAESRFQRIYWFSDLCKVPEGLERPRALPAGAEKAGAREFVNAQMPDDCTPLMKKQGGPAFDYQKHPSRRGNRLYWRDGRVTNLEGTPL